MNRKPKTKTVSKSKSISKNIQTTIIPTYDLNPILEKTNIIPANAWVEDTLKISEPLFKSIVDHSLHMIILYVFLKNQVHWME